MKRKNVFIQASELFTEDSLNIWFYFVSGEAKVFFIVLIGATFPGLHTL